MCGFIAGEVCIGSLLDRISYRGLREYKGYKEFGDLQMAHIALPFVNLDPKVATQPFKGSMLVGEIFNYKDLGEDYINDTHCADDIFKRDGLEGFHRFDGFWSFVTAIWDKEDLAYKVLAATDYLSQKPIYYRTDMEVLASEIDVLKEFGPVTRNDLFHSNVMKWGYDPSPRTPWMEIKQIPPGCYYYKGGIFPYWDWNKVKSNKCLKEDLKKSVKARLGGQREVSLLLSGGLDSTIIFSIIKDLGYNVKVFHVDNQENEWANLAFNSFSTDGDTFQSISLDEVSDMEALIIHQTPVDLGSVKPQIAMAQAIRDKGSYCVMTGDGADELFGGYRRAAEYDSQFSDVFMELPYYHNPKLDRTMMRCTIELRSPFLSSAVVKYALQLPYSERNGEKKILKELFKDDVPKEILNRKKHALKTPEIRKDPMSKRNQNRLHWEFLTSPKVKKISIS